MTPMVFTRKLILFSDINSLQIFHVLVVISFPIFVLSKRLDVFPYWIELATFSFLRGQVLKFFNIEPVRRINRVFNFSWIFYCSFGRFAQVSFSLTYVVIFNRRTLRRNLMYFFTMKPAFKGLSSFIIILFNVHAHQ